jgi:hypothetical protein
MNMIRITFLGCIHHHSGIKSPPERHSTMPAPKNRKSAAQATTRWFPLASRLGLAHVLRMDFGRLFFGLTVIAFASGVPGCDDDKDGQGTPDGAHVDTGDAGTPMDTAGVALGPDGYSAQCELRQSVPVAATGTVAVEIEMQLDGKPLRFGEENPLVGGGSVLPTNFRYYLSGFELHGVGGTVPGTVVDATGMVLPYNTQFVNVEDATTLRFSLKAPPGNYDRVSFLLGLTAACNDGTPRQAPLDQASQMKWPHASGLLFLRFEGRVKDAPPTESVPNAIHMGAPFSDEDRFAPKITLNAALEIATTEARLTLSFAVDQMFAAAIRHTDLSNFQSIGGDEVVAGERLRRALAEVSIFSVAPAP